MDILNISVKEKILRDLYERINTEELNEQIKKEMKNLINFQFRTSCVVCKGHGHRSNRCATIKKIRKMFFRTGCELQWRQIQTHKKGRSLIAGRG